MRQAGELTTLFRREFELCNIRDGELVAILSDARSPIEYVVAATGAAQTLGADVFEVAVGVLGFDVPTPVRGMGAGAPALVPGASVLEAIAPALERADFVIDLVRETIVHLPLRERLCSAGTRTLTIVEAPEILERMMSTPKIKESVEALGRRVAAASRLTVTSPAGTDLSYRLNQAGAFTQYGYADEPGRWDHWPSALVVCYPEDGSATGRLVLAPGDILFPFKRYVATPVELTIDGGYVTDIAGGLEAELLDGYLASWEDPEVYAVSHVGFGMHPRGQWSALEFYDAVEATGMDGRSFKGNFIFSTGPNRYSGRHVQAHIDIPMRSCTARLDDQLIVENGVMLDDDRVAVAGD